MGPYYLRQSLIDFPMLASNLQPSICLSFPQLLELEVCVTRVSLVFFFLLCFVLFFKWWYLSLSLN